MAERRRIGVMGGTFDPIHYGHLATASEVFHRFRLDEVVFVPAGRPWQKSERVISPAEDRYLMTAIATASDSRFRVSRVDIDRRGPTYTVDTLRDLAEVYGRGGHGGGADFFLITGADALVQLRTWHRYEEVLAMAHLIGVNRPGHDLADHTLPDGALTLVDVPALAISSTDIRARVAAGAPVDYLLPPGVAVYLHTYDLYRPHDPERSPRAAEDQTP